MTGPGHRRGSHRGGEDGARVRRLPVLLVVVAALVGAGVASALAGVPAQPGAGPVPASLVAAPGAQSSTWYCAGGTGTPGGGANATLVLTNSSTSAVTGSVSVVNDKGASGVVPVTVPGGGQTTVVPGDVAQGQWVASRVSLNGGGVAVSQTVSGPLGWAMAPCATSASASWYFATGSTTNGDTMFVSIYNPTADTAVVDMTFVTPTGTVQPQPFQGLVLAPGGLVVVGVAAYVQNQNAVATSVRARSGQVVAELLQEHQVGPASGLSLRLGAPEPQSRWSLPRTRDVPGGQVTLVIFNPTASPEHVSVSVRLASGPVSPLGQVVAPDSAWQLVTNTVARIPAGVDYAVEVTASGGPGVVVDRITSSAAGGALPQWGAVQAVGGVVADAPSRAWIVPSPALPVQPAVAGAATGALDVQNVGSRTVTARFEEVTAHGAHPLPGVPGLRIPPGAFAVISQAQLAAAGDRALLVRANGPLAVAVEGAPPTDLSGNVGMAGVPLAG